MAKQATILIAGGAGFIGSRVANLLAARKFRVVVVDDLSTGDKKNCNEGVVFYNADIADRSAIAKIFTKERPDIVINDAAKVYWTESEKNSARDVSISVIGTINLLEESVKHNVKKFIFRSSISAYGRPHGKKVVRESDLPSVAAIPPVIFSYALTKRVAEDYIQYFHKKFGLPFVILRCGHVYGPGQIKQHDVISIFVHNALGNKPFTVNGGGKDFRDYVYIDDVASATLSAIKLKTSGIYNIGGGEPITANNLISALAKITRQKFLIKKVGGTTRPDGLYMDSTKAKKELRWTPRVSLEKGLSETLKYYKKVSQL